MRKSRNWIRTKISKQRRAQGIEKFELWKAFYDKGVGVLASLRVVALTDVAILMGVFKYIFGPDVSLWWVVGIGVVYYPIRTAFYLFIGKFWEDNNGFKIQAEVQGKRAQPGRVMLVDTEGNEYDLRNLTIKEVTNGRT